MTAPSAVRVLEALPTRERGTFVRAGSLAVVLGCSSLEVLGVLRELETEGDAERYQEGWRRASGEDLDATKSTARQGEVASPTKGKGRNPTPISSTRGNVVVGDGQPADRGPQASAADPGAPAGPDPDADAETPGARHPDDAPAATPSAHRPGKEGATREGREAEAGPRSVAPAGDTPSGERAPIDLAELAAGLRAVLAAEGWSQRQLAQEVGVTSAQMSYAVRGIADRKVLSRGPLARIAAWLDARPSTAPVPPPGEAGVAPGATGRGEPAPVPSSAPAPGVQLEDVDPPVHGTREEYRAAYVRLENALQVGADFFACLREVRRLQEAEATLTAERDEARLQRDTLIAQQAHPTLLERAAETRSSALLDSLRRAVTQALGDDPDTSDGDLVHHVRELARARSELEAELGLVDRVLLTAGTSIDWPRQIRLGQLLERLTRKTENA